MRGRALPLAGMSRRGYSSRRRRFRRPPGPQGGTLTPFPQAPLDVLVEILVDNSWLAITHDVFGSRAEINITRGAQNEGGQTQAGVCRMQINNRNGVYSPRNPTSPLYRKIGRNTGIRVKVGADVRFRGEIPAWPQNWDTTGNDVWVDIEAAGILRRLGQRPKPARSALVRRVADFSDAQFILVHWPFEDDSNGTFVATVTDGAGPIAVATGLRFAADDFLPGSKPVAEVPANTAVHYHGIVPVDPNPAPSGFEVDFFVHMPVAPVGATRIKVVGSSGTVVRWEISVSSTQVVLTGVDASGTGVVLDSFTPASFFFADKGLRYRLRIRDIGGGTVSWALDMTSVGATAATNRGSTYSGSAGRATYIANAVSSTVAYGIGHVIVSSADGFTNNLSPADIGHAGETADERIRRLCAEEGVSFRLIGTRGDTPAMGPQGAKTFIDLLRECEAVDGGILSERIDTLALLYRTRKDLYTQQATLALDYEARHLASTPVPVDDDEQTVNDFTATRSGGSSIRHVETTGPLSVNDPPDGVGVYDESRTLNLERDDQLPQRAAWWVHLGTVDEARHPEIHVNMAKAVIATNPDLVGAAQQVRLGDRVTINNPPPWLPREPINQLVVGVKERLGTFGRDLRFHTVPASPYEVGVADDPDYRIDNDGSTINTTAASGATSLSVSSTNGLWTTDAGDMPFDIFVSGERSTVTAISGASSPQTFTVTRSINGVVKELPAGAEVHVFSPFMAGL